MTTIHIQRIGDRALIPQRELDRLVELAKQHDEVAVRIDEDDLPTFGIMRLAEESGAFDFWREPGEEIYTAQDGEPV